ncbi:MAG TPA: hypothetical protein VNA69_13030 [Thermoanaerobaculia bacterium]|nr:hypothetical protein [Thermoanaerobaculia bacterium]
MHFVAPGHLAVLDAQALDELLARSELTIAMGEGDVRGLAAAALLFSDFAVLRTGAVLHIDCAEAWAGAVWRLGRGALSLVTRTGSPRYGGLEARATGLCDELASLEPSEWLEEWIRNRSVVALDAAATLIRSRGGDRLERAEFARLFAIGEPQKGLGAFLAKVKPEY